MLFSIITPCFNSSKTLERTYHSLCGLDVKDFEWILIDDASNDGGDTRELIRRISTEAPFPVSYKFLDQNYFGSRSVYEATLIASGEYGCILDHDDLLTANSLSVVKRNINLYKNEANLAGVCGRCVNENGIFIGGRFKADASIASEGDIRFKKRISGEFFQFTRLELLKHYFSFMKPGYTNGFVWAKISETYRYVYIDDVLRVYDTALETSYSNNKKQLIRCPENKHLALLDTLNSYSKYLIYNPLYSIRLSASGVRHALNAYGNPLPARKINGVVMFFYFMSIPLGWLKYKGLIR
jgi:glycosyltransferase involved in cell wall biosynthesis